MKLTLEGESKVSVEIDAVTLDEVIENLIKPALLAYGFHPENIDDYFVNE